MSTTDAVDGGVNHGGSRPERARQSTAAFVWRVLRLQRYGAAAWAGRRGRPARGQVRVASHGWERGW